MTFLIDDSQSRESGIYIIRNMVNDKVYVGSAKILAQRYRLHFNALNIGKHHSTPLQNFVNKYGLHTLRFELLEICPASELITREQHHIDAFKAATRKAGYNVCPTAGSQLGFKHSAETKAKISQVHSGRSLSAEHRLKISAGNKDPSEGTRAKRSAASKARSPESQAKITEALKKRVISEETRARLRAAQSGPRILTGESRRIRSEAARRRVANTTPEQKAALAEKRSAAWAAKRLANSGIVAFCKHGHEYTSENTAYHKRKSRTGRSGTRRVCLACIKQASRDFRRRKNNQPITSNA